VLVGPLSCQAAAIKTASGLLTNGDTASGLLTALAQGLGSVSVETVDASAVKSVVVPAYNTKDLKKVFADASAQAAGANAVRLVQAELPLPVATAATGEARPCLSMI
jgi:hypothetical protein